jgi:Copper type II ascorbate-dependent monooxygenase, C-terminal domain
MELPVLQRYHSRPDMRRRLITVALAASAALVMLGARHRASRPPAPAPVPTFSREVSRIFQANCDTCHHPGDIAPFSLMTYKDAVIEADNIRTMVQTRQMPPWKPVGGCAVFAAPRVLSQDAVDTIVKWVDAGAPEGNPADLPPALHFDGGWALGEPDFILSNPKPYTPPASGDMYRCYSLSLPSSVSGAGNLYVSAIDIRPGDREIVHHAIAFIDGSGESAAMDAGDGYPCFGGPGIGSLSSLGSLGGWAPGARASFLPDGVAMQLPSQARIILQVHYHPHFGRTGADQTQLGIYLSRKPVDKVMTFVPVINTTFTIPAGASDYQVIGTLPLIGIVPVPVHVIGIFPHMHLLGRKMRVEADLPTGETSCLIDIEDWDFNWQGLYQYATPVALPAGTRPTVTAIYDNSASNPRNPNDPPKPVSWGEATTDEMCIAFLAITFDNEHLLSGVRADRSWLPAVGH